VLQSRSTFSTLWDIRTQNQIDPSPFWNNSTWNVIKRQNAASLLQLPSALPLVTLPYWLLNLTSGLVAS